MNRRALLIRTAVVATAGATPVQWTSASRRKSVQYTVEIRDSGFSPSILQIRPGDRVVWVNRDTIAHTATAQDGSWDTGELIHNQRAAVVITGSKAGDYFCRFHSSMTGKLHIG